MAGWDVALSRWCEWQLVQAVSIGRADVEAWRHGQRRFPRRHLHASSDRTDGRSPWRWYAHGCSEDTYLFYKILKAAIRSSYEPAAYVWHKHRRDLAALRRQLYNYSKGHVAYQLTTLLRDHDRRAVGAIGDHDCHRHTSGGPKSGCLAEAITHCR